MTPPSRLDELLAVWQRGVITAAEQAELVDLLEGDAQARAELVQSFVFRHQVRDWLRERHGADDLGTISARRVLRHRQRARHARPLSPAWKAILATAAVLFIACAAWLGSRSAPGATAAASTARIDAVSGEVTMRRGESSWPATSHQDAAAGDRLSTGAAGRAEVTFADGTTIAIGGDSVLELQSVGVDQAKILRLDRGRVMASVSKQPPGLPMRLLTPNAEAVVRGTKLTLSDDGRTRLEVTEGVVDLLRGRERVAVAAGHFALAGTGVDLIAQPLPTAPPSPVGAATAGALIASDFEDGSRPDFLKDGSLVSGPPRAASRFCVAGIPRELDGLLKKEVWFERPRQILFTLGTDTRATFDCWYTGNDRISLCIYDETRHSTFDYEVTSIPRETWSRISVRFADFRQHDATAQRPQPGDEIKNLLVSVYGDSDNVLYLDSLQILQP